MFYILFQIIHITFSGSDVNSGLSNLSSKYGEIFGLDIGPLRSVVISGFDLILDVFGREAVSDRPDFPGFALVRGGN